MGDFLGKLFVEVALIPQDGYGFIQVLFLGAVYLYILLIGANMIGDGSELLMLIPSLAGVVGSVILPVLGAVPDGAIVLFSGLGPADTAASQVSIGVGALAGSTVMLLTIPWFLSIVGGAVPIGPVRDPQTGQTNMQPLYGKKQASDTPMGMSTSGVGPDSSIRKNAVVMVITCLPCYLIVEIPALIFIDDSATTAAKDVNPFAWIGAVICAVLFFAYIAYQYYLANVAPSGSAEGATDGGAAKVLLEQRVNDIMIKAIKTGRMGLRGLLMDSLPGPADAIGNQQLADEDLKSKANRIVRPFFNKFDLNGDGTLSRYELGELLHTLGERVTPAELEELFRTADTDGSGEVDFNEFATWIVQLIQKEPQPKLQRARTADARMLSVVTGGPSDPESATASLQVALAGGQQEGEDDDDDDDPEVPEDILDMHLSPDMQRKKVLQRSCYLMGIGTLIVLLFSDPMVDVLDQIGTRTGVPPFFVAFVLGPIASNASEMVASYKYAQKKSQKTISVAFSQLLGAASMNNTFCLFIFYLLIACRGFGWVYHAEVLGIVLTELAMAVIASKRVHTVRDGLIALSLFPLCLVIVALFKATVFKSVEG